MSGSTASKLDLQPFALEFLGTGTSQGVPEIGCTCTVCVSADHRDARLRCSIHITHGNTSIVVDTGPDFRQQALRADIPRIDSVFYTHTHADHVMGLDDLRQFNRRQDEPIPVFLPRHFENDVLGAFGYAFKPATPPLYRPRLDLTLLDAGQTVGFQELTVQYVPVNHGADDIAAYLFDDGHRRVGYVSECKFIPPDSMRMLQRLDALIIGAIWDLDKSHPHHLTLAEAQTVIETLAPKAAYVTHVTHLMGLHGTVEERLPDHVRLAYDGLRITL